MASSAAAAWVVFFFLVVVLVPEVEVGVDCRLAVVTVKAGLGGWGGWLTVDVDFDGPHHSHVHHHQCFEVALHMVPVEIKLR